MTTAKSNEDLFSGLKNLGLTTQPTAAKEAESEDKDKGTDGDDDLIQEVDDESEALNKPTELDMLKSRARMMGLQFSNNIGLEALKAKVNAKLSAETAPEVEEKDEVADEIPDDNVNQEVKAADEIQPEPNVPAVKKALSTPSLSATDVAPKAILGKKKTERQRQYEEQMKLVRVRITNLNPSKKDLPGEIFTVANRVLGAVKKYVPYGEATENGYHIPVFIYNQLKEREFLSIKTRKDSRGRVKVETGMVREFALEILPQLTELELAQLAAQQAAARGMD